MLKINEIFHSIQGESTQAGRPCVFVRLAACHLRCTWCDTEYAFYEGQPMSLDAVLDEVDRYDCSLVEITGGEPLLQEDVYPLMDRFLERGYEVLLETSGSISTERVPDAVGVVLDLKAPGSGEEDSNDWSNLQRLQAGDQVKIVLRDRADYEWASEVVLRHRLLENEMIPVLLSPVWGELDPRELAEWILADGLAVRMQLQLHKIIWDPTTRGV